MTKDRTPLRDFLPLPYLDAKEMSGQNLADYRRIKAAGHVVYVRKLSDGAYEMVDGGPLGQVAAMRV